jgi:hypothetical protein
MHRPPSSPLSWIASILATLVLLVALYVLSTGPVCGLSHRGYLGPHGGYFLACFYAPVEYACDSELVCRMLVPYISFWMPPQVDGPNGEVTPVFGPY